VVKHAVFVRPPDIHIGGLVFTTDSFFFFRRLISELAERNSTKIGHIVGSKRNLKKHIQNPGIPFPCKSGVEKPPFLDDFATQRQTLTAYVFGVNRIDNGQVR